MWTSDIYLTLLRIVALISMAMVSFTLVLPVARIPAVEAPSLGLRGRNRAAVRLASGGFALVEPLVARVAGLIRVLRLSALRRAVDRVIRHSGDVAGLWADEFLALSVLSLLAFSVMGFWFVHALHMAHYWLPLTAVAGALAPWARLHNIGHERAKALERSLPYAMDLCVLCMGAGTDFPSALTFAARELGHGHEVCREELSVLLEQLSLGRTRVEALEDLSLRSGSQTVQQFVAAVCQSETKGTPLVEALTIQSATLRQRRSVLAEELAAKAGVRMMMPLMLMVGSLLLIIFGPFIVNGIGL